jgi:hypothetical protein
LTRLSAVEARLGKLEEAPAAAAPQAARPAVERQAQYGQELLHQSEVIAEHEREQRDESWAPQQSRTITELFAPAEQAASLRVKNVDCRSKTCVATLTYPTPDDALTGHALLAQATVAGCHGLSSTLAPPTSAGSYDVGLVYYCR